MSKFLSGFASIVVHAAKSNAFSYLWSIRSGFNMPYKSVSRWVCRDKDWYAKTYEDFNLIPRLAILPLGAAQAFINATKGAALSVIGFVADVVTCSVFSVFKWLTK